MAPPRRVPPPAAPPPARAWLERETPPPPPERCRLLDAAAAPPPSPVKLHHQSPQRIQLALTAYPSAKLYSKCPESAKAEKSRFQRRKEKIMSLLKPPHFIISMIIIMVVLRALESAEARCGGRRRGAAGGTRAALEWMGDDATWWRQPWRLFSYSLLHVSASHLAINALVALAVGWRLEAEQGWWRVALVWWGGAAAGALAAGALQPNVNVVGASAAVFALLTAHLPNVGLRFGHVPLWWFRPLSVAVLGASEACWPLLRRLEGPHEVGVAWSAHALGAAVGLPLAFLVFTGEHSRQRWAVCARAVCAAALTVGAVVFALHYAGPLLLHPPS